MKNGLRAGAVIAVAFFMLLSVSYAEDCRKRGPDKVIEGKGYCYPQCVDFVKCYLGITGRRGNASEWWSKEFPGYKKHSNGKSQQAPKKNDIVCEKAANGHVSVIIDVNEKKKTIRIAQTNYPDPTKCAYSEHTFGYSKKKDKYSINGPNVLGWLSKKQNFEILGESDLR